MTSRSNTWRRRGIAAGCIVLAAAFVVGSIAYSGRLTPVPLSWIFGDAFADDSDYVSQPRRRLPIPPPLPTSPKPPQIPSVASVHVIVSSLPSVSIADGMDPSPANSKRVGDDWQERQAANMAYISTLGMHHPMEAVVSKLGTPDFTQTYNNGVDVLMYRTRQEKSDFLTTKEETAILVFQHGGLIGLSNSKDWFELDRIPAEQSDYRAEQSDNRRKIRQLSIGDPGSAIIAKLGHPDFLDYPADDLEILSYRTHAVELDGFTKRDETTRLMLRDGILLAVGE